MHAKKFIFCVPEYLENEKSFDGSFFMVYISFPLSLVSYKLYKVISDRSEKYRYKWYKALIS